MTLSKAEELLLDDDQSIDSENDENDVDENLIENIYLTKQRTKLRGDNNPLTEYCY